MIALFTKIALGVGAAAAAKWLIPRAGKLVKLKNTSDKMEMAYTLMVHKIDLKGLIIRVDANLKNPSQNPVKMKFPFIKLVYQNTTIGTSQVVDKNITIPKWGEAVAEAIMISVPYKGIFSLGGALMKSLTSGETVKMQVTAQTDIDMGANQKPYHYSSTQEVSLKS